MIKRVMTQAEHENYNSSHYPGTRQLCSLCGEPTGRCEDDTIWSNDDEPICVECYYKESEF